MSTGETQLFTPTGELTQQAMHLYSQNALAASDMQKIEAYLEENPFEAEAFEGLTTYSTPAGTARHLDSLREDLHARTGASGGGKLVKMAYWQAAAAVLIMVGVFAASIVVLEDKRMDSMLAMQQERPESNEARPDAASMPPPVVRSAEQSADDVLEEPTLAMEETEEATPEIVEVPDEEQLSLSYNYSASEAVAGNNQESTPLPDMYVEYPDTTEEDVEEHAFTLAEVEADEIGRIAFMDSVNERQAEAGHMLAQHNARAMAKKSAEVTEEPDASEGAETVDMSLMETVEEEALFEKTEDAKSAVSLVYGKVLSGAGTPLYNVTISIVGTGRIIKTDRQGDFKITVDDPTDIIRFSYRGISDLDVPVANREHLVVTLSSRGSWVNAIGADGREIPTTATAKPGGGYSAYKTYLRNVIGQTAATGRIVVELTVTEKGEVRDIEVIKSLDAETDAAAIEAILNGPRWQPAFEQGMAVPSRARLRLRL